MAHYGKEAIRAVYYAIDHGINMVDTANKQAGKRQLENTRFVLNKLHAA